MASKKRKAATTTTTPTTTTSKGTTVKEILNVVVTSFESRCRHPLLPDVLSVIQKKVSQIMTLAVKLGSFYILSELAQASEAPGSLAFYCEQTFWRSCIHTVSAQDGKATRKNFKGKDATHPERRAWNGLQQCWARIRREQPAIPKLDRANLKHFLENQIVLYLGNIKTMMTLMLKKRMSKAISAQTDSVLDAFFPHLKKPQRRNLHPVILGILSRGVFNRPEPKWQAKRLKLREAFITREVEAELLRIVAEHHAQFCPDFNEFEESLDVQKNPFVALPYLRYLYRVTTSQNSNKAFTCLPQWNAKARFIQLDRFSLGYVMRYARDNPKIRNFRPPCWFPNDPDLAAAISQESLSFAQTRRAFHILFKLPHVKNVKQCSSMRTDLKRICWLFKEERIVPESSKKHKNNKRQRLDAEDIPVQCPETLPNGLYHHGQDFFMGESKNVDFIFIDPGHVNIMTGVREFAEEMFDPKHAATHAYKLTNRQNMHETGNLDRRKWAQKKRKKDLPYTAACQELQNFSHKTWDPGQYLTHFACYLRNWNSLFEHSFKPYVREFAFASYQAKQRRVHKIRDALQSPSGRKTIVVVGNGVQSATSRGRDAAPGKELRRELARFFPIVMACEHRTSKMSCCCNRLVLRGRYDRNTRKSKNKKTKKRFGYSIRGLAHCSRCGLTFDRDISAALNIRSLFWVQALGQTHVNYLDE